MLPAFDFTLELSPNVVPAEFYWSIPQGDARVIRFHLTIAGQPVDLTDYTITFTAKRTTYDPTPLIEATGAAATPPTSALIALSSIDTATAGTLIAAISAESTNDGPFTAIGTLDILFHA